MELNGSSQERRDAPAGTELVVAKLDQVTGGQERFNQEPWVLNLNQASFCGCLVNANTCPVKAVSIKDYP